MISEVAWVFMGGRNKSGDDARDMNNFKPLYLKGASPLRRGRACDLLCRDEAAAGGLF
jgi:hypothetical protein